MEAIFPSDFKITSSGLHQTSVNAMERVPDSSRMFLDVLKFLPAK